jgi:hypothetical protein
VLLFGPQGFGAQHVHNRPSMHISTWVLHTHPLGDAPRLSCLMPWLHVQPLWRHKFKLDSLATSSLPHKALLFNLVACTSANRTPPIPNKKQKQTSPLPTQRQHPHVVGSNLQPCNCSLHLGPPYLQGGLGTPPSSSTTCHRGSIHKFKTIAVGALLATISTARGLLLADATEITTAITHGPWTGTDKIRLASALSDATSAPRRQGPRANQSCMTLENYFTASDWATLMDDDLALNPKTVAISGRMHKLGMTCPCEKLLMRAGAIIHAVGMHSCNLDPASKQQICRKVKDTIKMLDKTRPYQLVHMPVYPHTPDTLPDATYHFAYDDGLPVAPPAGASIDEAATGMCYRSTHKMLRADLGGVPQRSTSQPSSSSDPMMMMMNMMMNHLGMNCTPPANGKALLNGMKPGQKSQFALLDSSEGMAGGIDRDHSSFRRSPTSPVDSQPSSAGTLTGHVADASGQGFTRQQSSEFETVQPPQGPGLPPQVPALDDLSIAERLEISMRESSAAAKGKAKAKPRTSAKKGSVATKKKAKARAKGKAKAAAAIKDADTKDKKKGSPRKRAAVDYSDLIDIATQTERSVKQVTSRAYHGARTRALAEGWVEKAGDSNTGDGDTGGGG